MRLHRALRTVFGSIKGATSVEYGLIVAMIVLAMMAGLQALGGGTSGMWNKILEKTATAMAGR